MMLAAAVSVFVGFILCISGIHGKANSICALKAASVELSCATEPYNSSMNWFTQAGPDSPMMELSADGNYVKYNLSEEHVLTIKDLSESDPKTYCCGAEQPCLRRFDLHVTDLQVKVIPAAGRKVTLMCNTSCPLTEKPAAYIWYKNGDFLYKDRSPWYQELVSGDKEARYSCAVEGYEHLRAPEVSVDSVSSTCFTVTYAGGRMCADEQTVDNPCSITYPREVHIETMLRNNAVTVTCATSCPTAEPHTVFRIYGGRQLYSHCKSQDITIFNWSSKTFSCAINNNEDLQSAEVCITKENCDSANYASRRICALESSSVNISVEYLHSCKSVRRIWDKTEIGGDKDDKRVLTGRVEYHANSMNNHFSLIMHDLQKNDSGEYTFRLIGCYKIRPSLTGVTLIVTDLSMRIQTAEVTEGDSVTLTCSTSCPLADDTKYIWYFNSELLIQPENKHLTLNPVGMQHAGNYSCAVKTQQIISSNEKTLTVNALGKTIVIMNAIKVIFLTLFPIVVVSICLWMRKKTTLTSSGAVQPEELYESIPVKATNPAAQRRPEKRQNDTV